MSCRGNILLKIIFCIRSQCKLEYVVKKGYINIDILFLTIHFNLHCDRIQKYRFKAQPHNILIILNMLLCAYFNCSRFYNLHFVIYGIS